MKRLIEDILSLTFPSDRKMCNTNIAEILRSKKFNNRFKQLFSEKHFCRNFGKNDPLSRASNYHSYLTDGCDYNIC